MGSVDPIPPIAGYPLPQLWFPFGSGSDGGPGLVGLGHVGFPVAAGARSALVRGPILQNVYSD